MCLSNDDFRKMTNKKCKCRYDFYLTGYCKYGILFVRKLFIYPTLKKFKNAIDARLITIIEIIRYKCYLIFY